MDEIKFYELKCKCCGGQLKLQNDNLYVCENCGKSYEKQVVSNNAEQLSLLLNEQKQEKVANLRRQLWDAMHANFIHSEKIVRLAGELKDYLPEDYFANFCEVANSGNDISINDFLKNTSQENMADYADIVLDFMIKSASSANLTTISLFIERAFKNDTVNYDKYTTLFEEEAQKIKHGIYELNITRDVFLAYSSADIDKAIELCDFLEKGKLSCFLALRNLRHGKGAVDNYENAIKKAIDNCKTIVFVSSTNSRSFSCDAIKMELPYIKSKDLEGAPLEYKRDYAKMPFDEKVPRVEYLVEDYVGETAELVVKEFFSGLEWCKSKEAVAARIAKYLTEVRETNAQKAEREKREAEKRLEEAQRQLADAQLRAAKAQEHFSEAISRGDNFGTSSSVKALLKRAEQECESGNTTKAEEYYNKVLDIAPECSEAWLGLFYIKNGTTKYKGIKIQSLKGFDINNLSTAREVFYANIDIKNSFDTPEFKNALRYADKEEAEEVKLLKDNVFEEVDENNNAIFDRMSEMIDDNKNKISNVKSKISQLKNEYEPKLKKLNTEKEIAQKNIHKAGKVSKFISAFAIICGIVGAIALMYCSVHFDWYEVFYDSLWLIGYLLGGAIFIVAGAIGGAVAGIIVGGIISFIPHRVSVSKDKKTHSAYKEAERKYEDLDKEFKGQIGPLQNKITKYTKENQKISDVQKTLDGKSYYKAVAVASAPMVEEK